MRPLFDRLTRALAPLSEAGRLHGDRHIGREYGKSGGRDSLRPIAPGQQAAPARGTSKQSFRFRYDECILAMAEVEGLSRGPYNDATAAEWYDKQGSGESGTAAAAKKKLQNALRFSSGSGVDLDKGLELVAVIAGAAGNRWNVYLNGQVALDTKYAVGGGCIQKAKQLGFEID